LENRDYKAATLYYINEFDGYESMSLT